MDNRKYLLSLLVIMIFLSSAWYLYARLSDFHRSVQVVQSQVKDLNKIVDDNNRTIEDNRKTIEELRRKQEVSRGSRVEPIEMEATAYTWTGNRTAVGIYPREDHTVAVDPKVIPLGSILYIESTIPGISGYYVAEDTGGAVNGRHIDIYFGRGDTKISEALGFGRQTVKVQVLET